MKMGPHCGLAATPKETRDQAVTNGWTAFQTGWGHSQSLNLPTALLGTPIDQYPRDYDLDKDPLWVVHSAFLAHSTPKDHRLRNSTASYLKLLFRHARAIGSQVVVLHTGATKDKTIPEVKEAMRSFLTDYGIIDSLREINKTFPFTLAIENVAAKYEFNRDLGCTLDSIEGLEHISWCLDLAHRHAAGVSDENLSQALSRRLPIICHCNYPGSNLGGGLDRHGWRYQAKIGEFAMTEEKIRNWDDTVRLLRDAKVPLIFETPGVGGDQNQEIQFLRGLLEQNCDKVMLESQDAKPSTTGSS